MEAKRNGEYWRRAYECPFYQTNKIDMVMCEAGTIRFETKEGMRRYLDYCEISYRSCPIYISKMVDYEIKEREEFEEKCREYASRNRGT